jgi:hypothetical protein
MLALSTTTCIAADADYCTKQVLESTPAVRNNSCTVGEFHKTEKGDCFVIFQNCKAKIFNPKVNQVVDFTIPSVKGTFPNHENIKELKMHIIYNVNVALAMKSPQQQSQQQTNTPPSTATIQKN